MRVLTNNKRKYAVLFPFSLICLFAYLLIASAFNRSLFVTLLSFPHHLFSSNLLSFWIQHISCCLSGIVCLYATNQLNLLLTVSVQNWVRTADIFEILCKENILCYRIKTQEPKEHMFCHLKLKHCSKYICFAKRKILWTNFISIPWTQVSQVSNAIPDLLSSYLKHLPWGV